MQALIFDVDGTLADTETAHRQAFNAAFAEVGLDWFWDDPTPLAVPGADQARTSSPWQ